MKNSTRRWGAMADIAIVATVFAAVSAGAGQAQTLPSANSRSARIEDVRRLLTGLSADSMEGRGTGTAGSVKASILIADEFRRIGLDPVAGNSSYFQEIPFQRTVVDPATSFSVDGRQLVLWKDYSIPVSAVAPRISGNMQVVYGGLTTDTTFVPPPASISGRIVLLLTPPQVAGARGAAAGRGTGRGGGRGAIAAANRFAGAAALAILSNDTLSGRAPAAALAAPPAGPAPSGTPTLAVSRRGAELLLGAPPESMQPGANGGYASVNLVYQTTPAPTRNVAGILRGSDPVLRDEFILVDAHYDHLGIGQPVNGDSVFNGADDDASGTVAVMEIARALKTGAPPRRSIIFIATTGEERGLIGTNYFIANPLVPLDRIVANLEIEMIGRPDSLAGGSGKGWLTGYERSTMGPTLAEAGLPVVIDPRPAQNFFSRSDNIAFARMGIVAHTLSSFNLHTDYHRVTDDVDKVDFQHMTALINAAIRSVEILANGPRQTWKPGGQPTSGRGGAAPAARIQ
jgi:hypothetical protein